MSNKRKSSKRRWNNAPAHKKWYLTAKGRKSHLKSNAKWLNKDYRNRHRAKIYRLRSYCKNFILKKALPNDLSDIEARIKDKTRRIAGEQK